MENNTFREEDLRIPSKLQGTLILVRANNKPFLSTIKATQANNICYASHMTSCVFLVQTKGEFIDNQKA